MKTYQEMDRDVQNELACDSDIDNERRATIFDALRISRVVERGHHHNAILFSAMLED